MFMINGEGKLVGRVGSVAAKELLKGYQVCIYNAEKLLVSGNRKDILGRLVVRRSLQNKANPEHSPKWPKVPYLLVKRMIRGMLPWKTGRGRLAFKRLRVYNGAPAPNTSARELALDSRVPNKCMSVLELCRAVGYPGDKA